jgi:hypothetical protein
MPKTYRSFKQVSLQNYKMSLLRRFHQAITLPFFKAVRAATAPPSAQTANLLISPQIDKLPPQKKLYYLVGGFTLLYGLGISLLSWAWYRHQKRSTFHFFNDNAEWQQMDKFGHFLTAFHISKGAYHSLLAVEQAPQKALQYGGWTGGVLMTPIEVLDGFSDGYGASWGDELANFLGSAFFIWQQKQFGKIIMQPRFHFQSTSFAALRPSLLGKDWTEQWLKDYNGQTYWLAVDLADLTAIAPEYNNPLLDFLSQYCLLGIGYSAKNMIFARDEQNIAAGFVPYREVHIGLLLKNNVLPTHLPFFRLLNGLLNIWASPLLKITVTSQ